ncbi:MAG: hypothetical protein ACRD9R_17985 [Pyrinomonadaceae bacterium]
MPSHTSSSTDIPKHADLDHADEENRFTLTPFGRALKAALARRGVALADLCDFADVSMRRLLAEYGAMFLAADGVLVPPRCVFRDEAEVAEFQARAASACAAFGADPIELQSAALNALLAARDEAESEGLTITPRGGSEAARRTYADTVRLWASRVVPALAHWTAQGMLEACEAERLLALTPAEQLPEVLKLEERGLFCSTDFGKSILYSVAAPGASQHLSLLAFDVTEFQEPRVRALLARHGWHQTVWSDLPHFTFLGFREKELPGLGLRRVVTDAPLRQTFWIPDLTVTGDE